MSLPRWRVMRIFRPRVLAATDLPDEIADHAPRGAFSGGALFKRLSTEVLLTRVAGWDEFHREFWES